ncbi:hypothetical protein MTO96_010891 [Rhipicephalus appendiculatus]
MDRDSRTATHRSRPNKGSSKSNSPGTRTRRNSLGEQLPGYLPKGRVAPKSYVPPKPRTPTAGQSAYLSGSQQGSDSPRTASLRNHRDSPSYPESPGGLALPSGGNMGLASHHRHQPSPRQSPRTLASPELSPALTMESPLESYRESPTLSPQECALPPVGGSLSPSKVETSSPQVLATSGRGTPESRASSRKRGGSGRVSWQQEHLRAEASAKRRAGPPSLYRWLVSRLPSRAGHERAGPDAEAATLDRTSEICSPRAFWKGTSSVSGPEGPVTARSTLRGDLCTAVLVVMVVVLATSLIWVLYMGSGERAPAAVTAQRCITDTCVKYEKLLSLTMDTSAPPCEDFYQYVCGTWLRTGNKPIYDRNWDVFLNNVGRRVMASGDKAGDSAGDIPSRGNKRAAEYKALTSIRACLSPLKRDNVEEVKEVLAAAGLPWPDRSAQADVIDSMFFMSLRVYHALFVDIQNDNTPTVVLAGSFQFKRVYERIGEHVTTKHISSHFRTSYESFANDRDGHRQEQLCRTFTEMKAFLDAQMVGVVAKSSQADPATFLSMTPPVPESRWDAAMRRYLNTSLRSFNLIYIENAGQFSALFRMWDAYGEENMTDFFGWFAVQVLLPFTNQRLLTSYFQSEYVGGDEMRKSCVSFAYLFFPVAMDNYLSRYVLEAVQYAKDLVGPIGISFHRLLGGNHSWLVGDALPQPNMSRMATAFEIVNAYSEDVFRLYEDFPDVDPEQPLRNEMKLEHYMHHRGKAHPPYRAVGANMFDGFRLNPQLLSFPWYASDARPAVLMGGLGSRLAGTLYLDFVERRPNPVDVYRENWRCLGLQNTDEDSHVDLVAAAAAVNIVWDTFSDLPRRVPLTPRERNVSRHAPSRTTSSEREVPGNYSDGALLFVFYCWLTCGDQWGPSMCNVPLKNSPHFGGVFGCAPGAPMNPTNKCRMIV